MHSLMNAVWSTRIDFGSSSGLVRTTNMVAHMQRAKWLCLVFALMLGTSHAARMAAEGVILAPEHEHKRVPQTPQRPLVEAAPHKRDQWVSKEPAGTDTGDYYQYDYQDQPAATADDGAYEDLQLNNDEQRNAYILEDPSTGRLAVVEQHTQQLPGGGRMTWQRTTGPGSVTLTAVSTSTGSNNRIEASMSGTSSYNLVHQLTSNMFGGAFSSALAPLNDLLDAFDAQQQRFASMMMSRYIQTAAAASDRVAAAVAGQAPHNLAAAMQQQGLAAAAAAPAVKPHMPCPRHQAMMAAAAAAAAAEERGSSSNNDNQQQAVEDILNYSQQFAEQQQSEMQRLGHQQKLESILADNGLALAPNGDIVTMEEALGLQQALEAPPMHTESDDVYLEYYSDDALTQAANTERAVSEGVDIAYDAFDGDYVVLPSENDRAVPPPPSSATLSLLRSILSNDGFAFDWNNDLFGVDLDLLLLMLLVACTACMCIAFLQSLLQLRAVLHGERQQQQQCCAGPVPVCFAAAVAAAAAGCCGKEKRSSSDDLSMPLLVSVDDAVSAQEQQQQQQQRQGAPFQRFYNPLVYQPLPGKM